MTTAKNPESHRSRDFFASFAEKYYSSFDSLDKRNGRGTGGDFHEMYESMSFNACAGIGILLVLAIIGLFILLRRDSLKSENNKRIYIAVGVLQAVHILLYLTGLLEEITQINVYIAFGICAIVSIICIVMSGWMLLPFSKFKHGVKYLLMFIAILQVLSTIIIFLLPEAGVPPLIQFSISTK